MQKNLLIILSVIMIVISFTFFGCTSGLKEGEVYEKKFKKKTTTTIMMPMTIFNGKTSTTMMIPYIVHYPDRWAIRIKCFDAQKDDFDYNEFYVTEECYNTTNIGDWFVYDENYCYDSEPCTKERA